MDIVFIGAVSQLAREVRGQRLCMAAWGLDLSASITIDRDAHAHTPLVTKTDISPKLKCH